MAQRDDDPGLDDDRPRPRRRPGRDVLNLGEPDPDDAGPRRGATGRRADHPRDLDDERPDRRDDEPNHRDRRIEARDDDRDERDRDGRDRRRDRFDDDDRRREPPRDRGARRRDDDDRDRDERAAAKPSEAGESEPDDRKGNGTSDGGTDRDSKGDDAKKTGKDENKDDDAKKGQEQRRKRRPVILGIAALVAVLLVAGGVYYYLSTRGKIDTDDAYTDGNVVNISPQVSGQVVELAVNDNQFVHKGDVLVRIDPRQFQYSAEQSQGTLDAAKAQVANQALGVEIAKKNFPAGLQLAKANLEAAQASFALSKANYDRQKSLPKQATTQQDVDNTASQYQQAQAQVDQAQARLVQAEPVQQNIGQSEAQGKQYTGQADQAKGQVDQANLNIEWATVRAPQDGWITRRNVNAGNYVSAGTQIMSLVTTDIWVTANYKETELDGMRPNQHVTIKVDAYPDLDLRGHVDSVQHGSGSRFSAFPAENATGNFVKIVQRVPVKIVIDSGLRQDEPLPLGVSVVPTVFLQ